MLKLAALAVVGTIMPDPLWNGTAASGFTGTPVDPPRTTAKPVMRLLVPPNQAFTDELLVGVYAGANNDGSLLDNMGLERVTAYFEGQTIDIDAPSFQTFNDANGNSVTYFGWWVKLQHNGTNGVANLYFEAVPRDATMQKRVMGPYTFLPSASLHDFDIAVTPSLPEVAGSRYQTIKNALTYLKGQSAQHPRILVTESGTYDIGQVVGAYTSSKGWCTIEAGNGVAVTIAKTLATRGTMRINYGGVRIKGEAFTYDIQHITSIDIEATGLPYWFDGCNFTNSAGRDALWNKGYRPLPYIVRVLSGGQGPFMTECTFQDCRNPLQDGVQLARGCSVETVGGDLAVHSLATIGCIMQDLDNTYWKTERPAMTVHYAGAGAAATLSLSGTSDANGRTFTARVDGVSVGTFQVKNDDAAVAAGTNFEVQNVVDWINGLSGWSAALIDGTWRATALSITGNSGGSFGNVDVKTAPLTLYTYFDVHPDIFQLNANMENYLMANNTGFAIHATCFIVGSTTQKDFLFVNNSFSNYSGEYSSQISGPASHGVWAHNSFANQKMLLRDGSGFVPDGYCLFANNSIEDLTAGNPVGAVMAIANNHLHATGSAPGNSTGTSTGGDTISLYADAANGNFAPAGALLANPKAPVIAHDRIGVKRGAAAPAGAMA